MGDHPDILRVVALLFLIAWGDSQRKRNMREVYFHCADADHLLIDHRGTAINDFSEACARAEGFVRALIMAPNTEDWRGWELRVTDGHGDTIFVLPFATVLGKLH
jgi:uncharacterized protein DUF6894